MRSMKNFMEREREISHEKALWEAKRRDRREMDKTPKIRTHMHDIVEKKTDKASKRCTRNIHTYWASTKRQTHTNTHTPAHICTHACRHKN